MELLPRSSRTTSAAPSLNDIFHEKGADDFDFGSPSLWGTDNDTSTVVTSASIINGDDLIARQEIKKLKQSNLEKNRAYIEQNIPFGGSSRQLSVLSCLSCASFSRLLPDDLVAPLRSKKVVLDLAGVLIPVLFCIVICSCEGEIDPDNKLVGRTLGLVVLIAGWWLAAPWPDIATSWSPVWLFP